ncbi:MAG: hypothetical protein ACRDHP_09080, partial [Ktedonobacterales bacterium]
MAREIQTAATGAADSGAEAMRALGERARRVLLHEQRTGHADAAVKPGGLESFVAHWATEMRGARRAAPPNETDAPEDAIARLVAGYRALDPMQRTARVRSALALLDTLAAPASTLPRVVGASAGRPTGPAESSPSPGRRAAARAPQPPRKEEPWPLAAPPPLPPTLTRGPEVERERFRPRPEDEYLLRAPVTSVPGVGATQAARLAKLGVETVRDLLEYYPREHRDYSKLQKIETLPFDEVCTVLGLIWEVQNSRTSGGRTRTIARISDETGAIRASWFNQPYLLKQLPRGAYI